MLKGIGPFLCGGEKKAVLTLPAAARPLWGVEGSDGCKPSVPEAVVVDRHCLVLRLAKRPEVERKC